MASILRWQNRFAPVEDRKRLNEETEEYYRQAIEGSEWLAKNFPESFIYKMSLARNQESLAGFLHKNRADVKSLGEAIELLEACIASLSESTDPWDARMQKFPLAKSYQTMSEILRVLGEDEKAAELAKKAGPVQFFGPGPPRRRGEQQHPGHADDKVKNPPSR